MRHLIAFIIVMIPLLLWGQTANFQIYYVNVSRVSGGAVNKGDTLEIRGVVNVLKNNTVTNLRFNGVVPAGTSYVPGTLAAKTNEGVTSVANTGNYTDASGDDRGQVSGTAITINLGQSAGIPPASGGSVTGGVTIPRFYSSSTIIQATFRVVVTANNLSTINITGNSFRHNSNSVSLQDLKVYLSPNIGCGGIDPVNQLNNEAYGTFETGTLQNRGASLHVTGFTFTNIAASRPQDGEYSVVKNSSPTQYTGATPSSAARVHTVWDIFGDHSGTTNSAGNPPSGAGASSGYFLMVNASYIPSTIFFTTVSGLLPNAQYTLRFWIRNICGKCAADPTIDGPMFPSAPGVKPALAFSIDTVDYYTSGDIDYGLGWVQKSFTFTTSSKTTVTFNIRNNAPGGGGNDWALDDLSLHQCLIVLPGSVSQISATRINGKNQVTWTAGEDSQVEDYMVEYSLNGRDFQTAGVVRSRKTAGSYRFTEMRSVNGQIYYRLKLVSLNGEAQYSKTVTISEPGSVSNNITVSPNPASGNPRLLITSHQAQKISIKVYDMSGRTKNAGYYQVARGQNIVTLLGQALEEGVYILVLRFEDGTFRHERLVVTPK